MEIVEKEYIFTDNAAKVNIDDVNNLLRQSYWARNQSIEITKKIIENSLCFFIFHNDKQVGFARVITDYTVYSLILDVIIHKQYRGNGLGKKLIEFINNHPNITSTTKVLWTKDADGLYAQLGFKEEACYKFMLNRH